MAWSALKAVFHKFYLVHFWKLCPIWYFRGVFRILSNIYGWVLQRLRGWEVLVEKPHHRFLIGFLMHLCFMLFMGTVSLKLLAFNTSRNNKHSIFNPSHPDSGFLKKLTWIFIFTLLCGTSKNFIKVVNAFIKPFEVCHEEVWK